MYASNSHNGDFLLLQTEKHEPKTQKSFDPYIQNYMMQLSH